MDGSPDYRTSYPINKVPVPKVQGISEGYLRPADGLVSLGTGPGVCRGGINWDGTLYRVMGSKLVKIDSAGNVQTIGDVGSGGPVSMVYSFTYLAIASNGNLFLYNGSVLAEVTDKDLGEALDVVWVDGYFMTTDGTSLVVTELADPFAVDPLKYGSSEVDPDPVVALVKLRNEIYAVNRYSMEVFQNVGGNGFPFQRVTGAQVTRGAVGTHAATVYMDGIAFVGSGRDESIGVFVGRGGGSVKISTREIDERLSRYSDKELSEIVVEVWKERAHDTLIIHTPHGALCFDGAGSQAIGQPIWYSLSSGLYADMAYRGKFLVWCHGRWNVGDTVAAQIGYLDSSIASHWGDVVAWEFGTPIVYNEGKGVLVSEIELVALTGSAALGVDAKVSAEYSSDGETWSMPSYVSAGKQGARGQRLRWLRQGRFREQRIYRFRGNSNAPITVARLDAQMEALAW